MNTKRIFFIYHLCVLTILFSDTHAFDDQKRAYGPAISTGTSSLATSQYTKPITPAQVNNTGGYEIKTSGYYFLTEDLFFYPKNFIDNTVRLPQASTIYISANNVVLDLNNKTISHLDSKTLAQNATTGLYTGKALSNDAGDSNNIAGIKIAKGVRNVTIKNGTLQYILGSGILSEEAAATGNTSNIFIDNINVINCGNAGISIGGTITKTYEVHIKNCSVSQCSGSIQYGDLSVARADSNLNGSGDAVGISLTNINNGSIINSSASNNQIDVTQPPTATLSDNTSHAAGLVLDSCNNISIENSVFNGQVGPAAIGIKMTSCNNIIGKKLTMNNNAISPLLNADNSVATGFSATDSTLIRTNIAAGVLMQDCDFCNFEDSTANNNTAYYRAAGSSPIDEIATSHGAGFLMQTKSLTSPYGTNNYNQFIRCQAHSNKGSRLPAGDTAYSDANGTIAENDWIHVRFGAGFLSIGTDTTAGSGVTTADADHTSNDDAMNTGNIFLECRASGNLAFEGNNNRDTKGCGIALLFDNAATIKNCSFTSNGSMLANSKVMGSGIYLGPLGITTDKPTDATYKTAYTKNAFIEENWLMANTWYGLYDDALDCHSLIMGNFAFRNGNIGGVHAEGNVGSDSMNYRVIYEQSDEKLPTAAATIGDFGALTVAHKHANVDLSVLAESRVPGEQSDYPSTT